MTEMPGKYKISISLNVLNHLGINLYSNIPAVLSEVVANSWDADAATVDIDFDLEKGVITVMDDGHGMTSDDLNNKFLCVGYQRRQNGESISKKMSRRVMGRKGIGKLSLFSIANSIEVHSVKDGVKSGLVLHLPSIQDAIKNNDTSVSRNYFPTEVLEKDITITSGTKIIISDFRKNINRAEPFLRTRLARRFAVLGAEHNFIVRINNDPLTLEDRDYFSKLQYLWTIGEEGKHYANLASAAEKKEHFLDQLIVDGKAYNVSGWIGTFISAGDAKDEGNENLNNISIIVRGKLAQEDMLDEFGDAGIYAQYLIGEIHADFLDLDEFEDIATSSRQKLIEDDPRYQELSEFIRTLLGKIRAKWTEYRNEKGEQEARKNPKIDEWANSLGSDTRKKAKALFGKINQMPVNNEERNRLFTHAVIAFEGLRYKDQLDALENISIDNLPVLANIFGSFDEIEASLYHQITRERIAVIKALQDKVTTEDAREKVIQEHLFNHLWLLDPMWERATETPIMEQTVSKEFGDIDAKLTADEKAGRLDIKYKNSAGAHIIIELKRASVNITTIKLIEQIDKYKKGLEKCLKASQKEDEPVDIVCVLGKYPTDWDDTSNKEMLKAKKTRIVLYKNLIDQAYRAYDQYLEKNKKAGRLTKFIEELTLFPTSTEQL